MPKLRLVGLKLIAGPTLMAVPLRATVWGLPMASSVKLSEALRLPTAVGVNVTLTLQVPLTATAAAVQVSALMAKSPVLFPVSATELIWIVDVLMFVSVTL